MIFEFADLWVIHSLLNVQSEGKATELRNLIAFADYTNHAIMTFDEFSGAFKKFIQIGLIEIAENELKISAGFKAWYKVRFEHKKRMNFQKEISVIHEYLKINYNEFNAFSNVADIIITKEIFDNKVLEYLHQ
ncbi:MAG: hypothetical protein U0W24_22805 [Bacteroidales bacterium]